MENDLPDDDPGAPPAPEADLPEPNPLLTTFVRDLPERPLYRLVKLKRPRVSLKRRR